MDIRNDSHCGLYCGSCILILGAKRGRLKALARQWKCTPQDLECSGCRSEQVSKFCSECTIRDCARERGVGFCIECVEYPCHHYKRLKELSNERPHLRLQPGELEKVRSMGCERWMEHQKKRWSCPECGEMFSWYEEKCSNCGAHVKSSVEEVTEFGLTEYPLDL